MKINPLFLNTRLWLCEPCGVVKRKPKDGIVPPCDLCNKLMVPAEGRLEALQVKQPQT